VGLSPAYGVGDRRYRNPGLQFGMMVAGGERDLRSRVLNQERCYHGGGRRIVLVRSLLEEKKQTGREEIGNNSV